MKNEDHKFKSGFVNIAGLPNAGKSTLTNALLGMDLNITNPKPQTTRHRIHAILNGDNYQVVISDTPGLIEDPKYAMQASMNKAAFSVLEDADLLLLVRDLTGERKKCLALFDRLIENSKAPVFLVLNKIDLVSDEVVLKEIQFWSKREKIKEIFPISAMKAFNVKKLLDVILDYLPEGHPYFDVDDVSDRPVRFFVKEIIRNHILDLYDKEIPYSCEVVIDEYKDRSQSAQKTLIKAIIFVMRESQKRIILGHEGGMIRKLGMLSRRDIENFLDQGVYLELQIKVRDNWRNDEKELKKLGY